MSKVLKPILFVVFGLLLLTQLFTNKPGALSLTPNTDTPTPTNTVTPTLSATVTITPTITATSTITSTPSITPTPTVTFTPTVTLPSAAGNSCVPSENERVVAKVVGITDGDTISVNIDGEVFKLRYIGVDSPETGAAWGSAATNQNKWLVDGQTVTLVKDVSETDRYDRLLRYVFVGDVFVNNEMAKSGWAVSGSWPPDTSCDRLFLDAVQSAIANQVGMWVPTSTPQPVVVLAPAKVATKPSSSNCDPSYPTVCIAPYPPDLDCPQIPYDDFKVIGSDPHGFDRDNDGIGCES